MGRRILSAILAFVLLIVLTGSAFADGSTTTYDYAAKDFSANTEIYAVTTDLPESYPYYGAKIEPVNGVYYGRTTNPDWLSADTYGLTNGKAMEGETAFAYYYSLGDTHSLEEYSYMFSSLNGGNMVFLLNFNFELEAVDCSLVLQGTYDDQLRETFSYLATMDCPLMLRIGGEVNVWSNMPEPALFIYAYRYVAAIASRYCPDMALVYSPNYSSGFKVDMDNFYPGDAWVDWIGASLYYNRYANNGDSSRDAFYGVAAYGNPLLNIQQVVNMSRLHDKPIIITEGGSFWYQGKENVTAFASENVEKAYAYLTMLYPEIKCIIYSDTNFGKKDPLYYIFDNAAMTAAYDFGVAANRTLLHSLVDTADYYTPLSEFSGDWSDDVTLAAYTCSDRHLTAAWYIDGEQVAVVSDYPYTFTVPGGTLDEGTHYLGVAFSNGESKTYMIQYFTYQPEDTTVLAGAETSFRVRALGKVDHYIWQYSENGIVWYDVSEDQCPSADTDTLSFPAETELSGRQYRCMVLFTDGAMITSEPAGLTVNGIVSQPQDVVLSAGSDVVFYVESQGRGASYQWQYSSNGGWIWNDITGVSSARTPCLTFPAQTDYDGLMYRCVVSFPEGQTVSEPASLTVNGIAASPGNFSAFIGDEVSMTVTASGQPRGYRWQYSSDGLHWSSVNTLDSPSAATSSLTFTASLDNYGYYYRCLVIFEDDSSVFSEPGRFTLDWFDEQPADVAASEGTTVAFTAKAHDAPVSYRWQYSTDGTVWNDISTANHPSAATTRLTFSVSKKYNGFSYRCIASFPEGEVVSDAARLSVY